MPMDHLFVHFFVLLRVICSYKTQHLNGPGAAIVHNTSPDLAAFPEPIITLGVLEPYIKSHRYTNDANWLERNIDEPEVEKIKGTEYSSRVKCKKDEVFPGITKDNSPTEISFDIHNLLYLQRFILDTF